MTVAVAFLKVAAYGPPSQTNSKKVSLEKLQHLKGFGVILTKKHLDIDRKTVARLVQ